MANRLSRYHFSLRVLVASAISKLYNRLKQSRFPYLTKMASKQNDLAKVLKSLHTPNDPLLLANVWDAASAALIAKQASCKAIATASYAIAMTQGVEDNDMTLEQNLAGIRNVVAGLKKSGKLHDLPLTADLQDGYSDPGETVRSAIALGVVGCNLEDVDNSNHSLRTLENSVTRIRNVMKAAAEAGVPNFVINARTDVLGFDGNIQDVIERGRAFLEAGATTVFVWGVGKWDIKGHEVEQMAQAFEGRLAVQPGSLGVEKLITAGVSRISVGPALWRQSMNVVVPEAEKVMVLKRMK